MVMFTSLLFYVRIYVFKSFSGKCNIKKIVCKQEQFFTSVVSLLKNGLQI